MISDALRFAMEKDPILAKLIALGTAAYLNSGVAAGNVPVLDSTGLLDTSVMPKTVITDTFSVASQAAMLALVAQKGDIAIRSDLAKTFVLSADPASTLANWKEIQSPTGAVQSVAGEVGAISATALRTALGLTIGSTVQAWDADLDLLAAVATTSFGRSLIALADAAALTGQINAFTSTLKGAVPASGGGTANFLRADGTWAAAGGSTLPAPMEYNIISYTSGDAVQFYWRNYTGASRTVSVTYLGANAFTGRINISKSTAAAPATFTTGTLVNVSATAQTTTGVVIEAGGTLWLEAYDLNGRIFGTVTATA